MRQTSRNPFQISVKMSVRVLELGIRYVARFVSDFDAGICLIKMLLVSYSTEMRFHCLFLFLFLGGGSFCVESIQ